MLKFLQQKDKSWMKKNLLFVVLLYLLLSNMLVAHSKTVFAQTLADFDSTNPPKEYSFRVIKDIVFDDEIKLEENAILRGKIVKVIPPKRLKKDAYFVFKVKSFTVPSQDDKIIKVCHNPKSRTKVKPYTPINKVQVAGKIATTAAGIVVKGLSEGVSFVEGVVQAKDGENRLGAGAKNLYEDSPFSYCEKGEELCLKTGAIVKLSLGKSLFAN